MILLTIQQFKLIPHNKDDIQITKPLEFLIAYRQSYDLGN